MEIDEYDKFMDKLCEEIFLNLFHGLWEKEDLKSYLHKHFVLRDLSD